MSVESSLSSIANIINTQLNIQSTIYYTCYSKEIDVLVIRLFKKYSFITQTLCVSIVLYEID